MRRRITIRVMLLLVAVVALGLTAYKTKRRYDRCLEDAARCDSLAKMCRDFGATQLDAARYGEKFEAARVQFEVADAKEAERDALDKPRLKRHLRELEAQGAKSGLLRDATARLIATIEASEEWRKQQATSRELRDAEHARQIRDSRTRGLEYGKAAVHYHQLAARFRAAARQPWRPSPPFVHSPFLEGIARETPLEGEDPGVEKSRDR